jgi:hypothetical protein
MNMLLTKTENVHRHIVHYTYINMADGIDSQ